ncbi:hypothetical protein ACOACO_17660 [Nocardioides sp. CPCC 205120]|uniref:hypothetical protein n=1 Tax=Nocardioides sp. CPCC 205120 TaxID=3406462 RepID=UPI003B512470
MENHAASAEQVADRVAASIRAAMAYQKKKPADLAAVLNLTPRTAAKRLDGELPGFGVIELYLVAAWLGTTPEALLVGDSHSERVAV